MWLGFDFGTQSVRVVAVSEAGCVLAQNSHPLTSRRDGSRHEQDAEEWWRAAVSACRAVLANLPPSAILGLAIDGTSGTILLIDKSGNALTAGLMYDDTRAADEARRANEAGADIWASRSRIDCSHAAIRASRSAIWSRFARAALSRFRVSASARFFCTCDGAGAGLLLLSRGDLFSGPRGLTPARPGSRLSPLAVRGCRRSCPSRAGSCSLCHRNSLYVPG